MIRLAVFLLVAGLTSVVQASIQPRIVGGKIASTGIWPSAVALQIVPNGNASLARLCGGNLIASNWVLTAAHCLSDNTGVQDSFPADITVFAGQSNLRRLSRENVFTVRGIFINPSYNSPSFSSDLALLELSEPTGQSTMPFGVDPVEGELATVVGWGTTQADPISGEPIEDTTSSKLREVSVPVVSSRECHSAYDGITSTMFCAGLKEGGKDSCTGDSGGPLMVQRGKQWQQIGIVSFGDGCAVAGKYGVYTRVAMFNQWIRNTMNGGDPNDPAVTDVKPIGSGESNTDSTSEGGDTSTNGASSGGGTLLMELLMFLLLGMYYKGGG
jgi:secreted trypsin-like serine protease